VDPLQLIPAPQKIEPKSGAVRTTGHGGVSSAFAEVLGRAIGRNEPVHVGAAVRDQMQRAEIEWSHERQATLGEAMGRLVQRGAQRGLVLESGNAFILSVSERALVEVISGAEIGNRVIDDIDAFALAAKSDKEDL
jgi:hypothetical protein